MLRIEDVLYGLEFPACTQPDHESMKATWTTRIGQLPRAIEILPLHRRLAHRRIHVFKACLSRLEAPAVIGRASGNNKRRDQ